jgi:cyanate lyase
MPTDPHIPDTPLDAIVRAALTRNRERMAGPRTARDIARATGRSFSVVRACLYGRRRLTFAAELAAALELDEDAVQAAGEATWAMRET